MKILLLCKKGGHKLIDEYKFKFDYVNQKMLESDPVNGKIIGEIDCNVEDIYRNYETESGKIHKSGIYTHRTESMSQEELIKREFLKDIDYLDNRLVFNEAQFYYNKGWISKPDGYAIHVDNINFFTEPQEISEYYYKGERLKNMPKNMLVVQKITNNNILLIRPYIIYFYT